MANVIRKLNEEGFPCYIMNLLRRKINVELIRLEEEDGKDDLDIARFKEIFI